MFFLNKACDVDLKSTKHEEINFTRKFIFMFIPYFIAVVVSKNVKMEGFGKETKMEV